MISLNDLPIELLREIFSFEVSQRKWRLVCKKFAECVPLHITVTSNLSHIDGCLVIQMLHSCNVTRFATSNWCFDYKDLASALAKNKSLKAVSIQRNKITSEGIRNILLNALISDTVESWNFGHMDFNDVEMEALATALRQSRSLRKLELDSCSFGEDTLGLAIGVPLKSAATLCSLTIKSCKLTAEDFQLLAEGASSSHTLTELDLSFTPFGECGAQHLGLCIGTACSISKLNLDYCNVAKSLPAIVHGIGKSQTLTHLSLKCNQIWDDGANVLAAIIPSSRLRVINLWDNGIHHAGAEALGLAIGAATNLQELQLGNNNIGDRGCSLLATGMRTSTALQTLGLSWNGISENGVRPLADALSVMCSVSQLDLAHNQLGPAGAHALSGCLRGAFNMEYLNVEGNDLNDEAVSAIALVLQSCRKMKSINFSLVDLGSSGMAALAQALAASSSLTSLSLKHTIVNDERAEELAWGLVQSTNLQHLDLQGCSISALGIQHLASWLATAKRLETLNLMHNNIGESGARALATAIVSAPTLRSIKVMYSELGPVGSNALIEAMQSSCTIKHLELNSSDVRPSTVPCDQPCLMMRHGPERKDVEIVQKHPFTCSRCHCKLYDLDPTHRLIIFCVDETGIIHEIMTPEEWMSFAAGNSPEFANPSTVQGQSLTAFMEHRLAGFYHTLCTLIWEGDLCHTQFQWYCDDPEHRREMLTFIHRSGELLIFCNVTVHEQPHNVPVSFMAGKPDSLLWRCPFCGWSCCNGGEWMQPEEFYLWCMKEWPALMRDNDFYPVVCDECHQQWVSGYANPQLQEAIRNLRQIEVPSIEPLMDHT